MQWVHRLKPTVSVHVLKVNFTSFLHVAMTYTLKSNTAHKAHRTVAATEAKSREMLRELPSVKRSKTVTTRMAGFHTRKPQMQTTCHANCRTAVCHQFHSRRATCLQLSDRPCGKSVTMPIRTIRNLYSIIPCAVVHKFKWIWERNDSKPTISLTKLTA